MKENVPAIGIIGGSGLYQMEQLRDATEQKIETPFGSPSDALIGGNLSGRRVYFLPRHGRGHRMCAGSLPSPPSVVCRKNTSPATFCCRRNSTTAQVCAPTTRFLGKELSPTFLLANRLVSRCAICWPSQRKKLALPFTT